MRLLLIKKIRAIYYHYEYTFFDNINYIDL